MTKRSVLCGAIGGIVISLPFIFISFLPSLNMETMLEPLIALGGVVAAVVLLYKNHSFKHVLLRTVLMFVGCIVATRLFAVARIIEWISNALHIQDNEAYSRTAGLGMALFIITLLIESVVISGILLVSSLIKRRKSNTGDG